MAKSKMSPEFKEGKSAAKAGKKVIDNPYKTLTAFDADEVTKYKDWLDGFLIQRGYEL